MRLAHVEQHINELDEPLLVVVLPHPPHKLQKLDEVQHPLRRTLYFA